MQFSAPASEYAQAHLVTTDPEASLRGASQVMDRHDIGALVVVQGARVVGVISERDVSHAVSMSTDLDEARVGSWMTSPAVTARPSDSILDVAYLMLDAGIRHIPLVDEHGTVSAMVSLRDIERPLLLQALTAAASGPVDASTD